jgi:hypothetical protein
MIFVPVAKLAAGAPFTPKENDLERNIETKYWDGRRVVKVTRSVYAFNAVPTCISHMQINEYGATHAEVSDIGTAKLYSTIALHKNWHLEIIFSRKIKKGT